jgi:hypothetical protein
MKTYLLYVVLLVLTFIINGNCVFAQKENTKVTQFNVKGTKSKFTILPRDNYFFADCKNKIKVVPIGKIKKYEVVCNNGKLTKSNDSIFFIDGLIGERALVTIFEILPNGIKKPAMNKEYIVVKYPTVVFNGSQCDSAISKLMLCGGRMYVKYKGYRVKADIISFKMEMYNGGKYVEGQTINIDDFITTDSSFTEKLNPKMREYARNVKGGELIYFKDIKYKNSEGEIVTEPILRLYLFEQNLDPRYFDF